MQEEKERTRYRRRGKDSEEIRPQLKTEGKWTITTPAVAARVSKQAPKRVRWVVYYTEGGRRRRKFFGEKVKAEGFVKQEQVRRENLGRKANSISASQVEESAEAQKLLEPFGVSILDVAKDYVERLRERNESSKVEVLISQFISSRKAEDAGAFYLRDLRLRLGRFCEEFGTNAACDVERKKVEAWLDSLGVSAVTRSNYLRNLKALFTWAEDRELIKVNPVAKIRVRKPKVDSPPEIFTPLQTTALLTAAQSEEAGGAKMIPYFALGLFAGIRPEELKRLDWQEIDLEADLIEITAGKAKTAQRRLVEISPNLKAWLLVCPSVVGAVTPPNATKLRRAAMAIAGIKKWPVDVMRHSFISYHLARDKDAAATALQAGHRGTDMIFRHYREIVKPKAAEDFWGISPKTGSKLKITKIA